MGGKDASDSTNLELVKVGRSGKVAIAGEDDEKNKDAAAFKRLMVKMQEEAKPVGFMHGRGDLDHDDILYLREQSQAEEDANRQRELNERRAFAAFKAAASAVDSPTASASAAAAGSSSSSAVSPKVHIQPKQKKGIRQSALLQTIVAVRPKKQGLSRSTSGGREDSGKRAKLGNEDGRAVSSSASLTSTLDKAPSSSSLASCLDMAPRSASLPGLVTSAEAEVTCSSRDGSRAGGAAAVEGGTTKTGEGPNDGASRLAPQGAGEAADAARGRTSATSISGTGPRLTGALMTPLHESASQGSLLGLAYDDSDEE